jgi:hypothetical protein
MLRFYIAKVLAYLAARMVLPAVWWFSPKSLTRWIDFNGWWVKALLDYAIASASPPWSTIAREFLWVTDKVGSFIQFTLRWRVGPAVRDHVEVLAKAFFTPGGWLMVAQLTFGIFLMIRMFQFIRKRRRASKEKRVAYQEKAPTVEEGRKRLPQAPQLIIPPDP